MTHSIKINNGPTILVEPMPHLHSVSTGIWAKAGSAAETPELSGVSHFLEHMLFKGTEKRSALDIAAAMESLGGVLNAFTGKEYTCYYTRSLDEHFEQSVELLADMYAHSLLDPDEFAREKNVIIEEINMYEDSPDDVVVDLLAASLWPEHPYGRPIAGSIESVEALTREQLALYWAQQYSADATVVAVAGNVSVAQVEETVRRYFPVSAITLPQPGTVPPEQPGTSAFISKDIEQTHVCMGFPGIGIHDEDYYPAQILVNALGGGASSRLFQEIREKRGLSYSAYAFLDIYSKGGIVAAYASTRPAKARELIKVMAEQIGCIATEGLSEEELQRNKTQLKGGLLLSMESSSSVMNRLGRLQLQLERVLPVEETVARLMAVTAADIERISKRLFKPGYLSLAVVGPEPCELEAKELF